MIKNVAIYTRVSTQEQVNGYSIDAQRTEIEKYCLEKGYKIIEYYSDAGITGTSISKRKQFKALLSDIQSKSNIDAIIIWKLSRISRRMVDLVNILEFLEENNVALISTTDNINTSTSKDKAFIYMAGIFAEMERDNIVEGAKNGMKQRAREGLWNGGITPIGYSYDSKKGLLIVPDEANTVRKIFDLYTNENWGYSKICKYLNERLETYATKKGNVWSYATVKQVLDNPTYVGKIRWGLREDWNKKRRKGITENYILADGKHEPIISNDLWERTRQKRELVGIKPQKKNYITYLLSGLPKCPQCGSSMTSHRIRDKKGEDKYYRYYSCSRWSNTKTCKPNMVRAEELENFIINKIKEFVNQTNFLEVITNNLSGDADLPKILEEIDIIKKSITKNEQDKKTYIKYLIDEEKKLIIGEDNLLETIREINSRLETLNLELKELEAKKENLENNQLDFEKISFILSNFEVAFENASNEEQIEIIHNLVKEIKINPSDKIDQRTVKEIVLFFNEIDLMEYDKKNNKSYEVVNDTGNRIISNVDFFQSH